MTPTSLDSNDGALLRCKTCDKWYVVFMIVMIIERVLRKYNIVYSIAIAIIVFDCQTIKKV